MLIPLQEILNKYNIHPKGVIQVGAHFCEEHEEFVKCGIERFVYVEPCRNSWHTIVRKFNLKGEYHPDKKFPSLRNEDGTIRLFAFACGAEEKDVPMYVSHQNQGQSNSFLKPNLHLQQHPEIIFDDAEIVHLEPLDNLPIDKSKYDFLYMDVQGFEGEVLKGSPETLRNIDIIYTEVNRGQTYSGNMEIDEMDLFLAAEGFKRVETHWPSPSWTWGDAVYVKQQYPLTSEDLDML